MAALKLRNNPLLGSAEPSAPYLFSPSKTPRQTEVKLARREAAEEAIGEITPGLERYIFTKGQFSEIDAIRAVVAQTGPCTMALSTWTATGDDVTELAQMQRDGLITSTRWTVDVTFLRREGGAFGAINHLFGTDAIRASQNHAKFLLARSATLDVVVLTSMNLNMNPRMEFLYIRESREVAEWLQAIVDDIFKRLKPAAHGLGRGEKWHRERFQNL